MKTTIKYLQKSLLLPVVLLTAVALQAQPGYISEKRGGRIDQNRAIDRSRTINTPRSQAPAQQPASINNSRQNVRDIMQQRRSMERPTPSSPTPSISQQQRQEATRSIPQRQISRPSNPRVANNYPNSRVNQPVRRYDNNVRYNRNTQVVINRNTQVYNRPNHNRYYNRPNNVYANPYRYSYNYPKYGQRYTSLNFNYRVIPFGGIGYYYNAGVFYRPYGSYVQVVLPPVGIHVNILPFGYTRFYSRGVPYYYYGNTFYRRYNDFYEVVDPPLGARLPALPRGAESVVIDGQRFYEDHGTFYMEEYNIENRRLYTVVGRHGVLDSETVNEIMYGTAAPFNDDDDLNGPAMYDELPYGSKKVNIDGVDYYRTQDDDYYQQITDGDHVIYQRVSN